VLAMLSNLLSVHAKEADCSADPQTGTDCAAAASLGGNALAVRQDANTHSSVDEEENRGESKVAEEAVGKAQSYTKTSTDTKRSTKLMANGEKEEWSTKLAMHKRLEDAELKEASKTMCKHVSITVHKAHGLLAQDSSIDPYVKVTYRGQENKDLTFETKYEAHTANPTWNHAEKVLLCNAMAPMRFAIYDKNWVTDTFVAQAELAGREFWEEGFSDSLFLEGSNNGKLYVTVQP